MPKNYNLFLKGDVGGWDFSSDMVNWILDKHKDSEVHVLINSLGGYTHEALAISSLFKIHGNVHVHFIGENASAATIAAMGAKRITIDSDACFLVHKCMNLVFEWDWLNADELDAHIQKLEKMKENQNVLDGCVAGMYAKRCKKSKDELLALMKKDTWLTADQAFEWGFVDEITDNPDDKTPELSESTLASLASAGIPVPPFSAKTEKGSIMTRFLSFLQSLTNTAHNSERVNKNPTEMADLSSLSAVIGGSLALSDGKFSLSTDQADKLNSKLDENKSTIESQSRQIEELKASVAEKERTIADLRNEPADKTSTINDDKKDDDPYAPVSQTDALEVSKAFLDAFK